MHVLEARHAMSSILYRAIPIMLLAVVVTGALLALMRYLIDLGDEAMTDPAPGITVALVPPLEMAEVQPKRTQKPKRPVVPDLPPPAPLQAFGGEGLVIGSFTPPVVAPASAARDFGVSDGVHLPLVKVEPAYPRQAMARGIEGFVVVRFDIDIDGSVANPVVIDNFPSGIFDSSALKAVARFKYQPQTVNGEPRMVRGVMNRFVFEMAK